MSNSVQKTNYSAGVSDPLNTPIQANRDGLEETFKKMLQAMMLQSFLPGMGEEGGGMAGMGAMAGMGTASGSQGMGAMPMASLMMSLMEQILSLRASAADEVAAAGANASTLGGVFGVGDPEVGGGILAGYPLGRSLNAAIPSGMPVEGRISQESRPGHVALDIAVPIGTPIRTTMTGRVVYAGWNNEGYGNLVIVENGPYRTYYAHLSEIPVVVGQDVARGSVIGQSGSTGNSTGPHLHYEIRKEMVHIDPTNATLHAQAGPDFDSA